MKEHLYANAFNQIPELGPIRLKKIRAAFGSWEEPWLASDLKEALEDTDLARIIIEKRNAINPEKEFKTLVDHNIRIMLPEDPEYPPRLRTIHAPPQILYVEGKLPDPAKPAVAIVGTRKPTSYGLEACEMITRKLTMAGIAIISGLARGIDAKAHETALACEGYTAAVLGSGIGRDALYPSSNRKLGDMIVKKKGALISEYPLHMKAARWAFPQRNRIVAGMTDGTIVVEASAKSGALITARFALEAGREVFAVPGQIFYDTAAGPNALIAQGAAPVTSAEDVLDALGIEHEQASVIAPSTNPQETRILHALIEPKTRDELIREIDGNTAEINQHISILEIRGMIKNIGSGMYRRV